MTRPRSFDRLAPMYETLERLAFGGRLHRARTAFLGGLGACRDILIVGDGDGRGLLSVLAAAPAARITSVDASAGMLHQARKRLRAKDDAARVTFVQADVRSWPCPPRQYDAVLTLFVLDCFPDADVRRVAASLTRGLRPNGQWLLADFAIPPRGAARFAGRAIVSALYAFFRWQTAITAKELAPFDAILESCGLTPGGVQTSCFGLVRASRLVSAARAEA
jgi:ubiquinone/menaquinone biosynthesis C-methylase UbiE